MHPYVLSGPVLGTPWVEKEDANQESSLRIKDIVKAGVRN